MTEGDGIGSGSFMMQSDIVEPSGSASIELIKMNIVVFWVMTPCSLVNGCLHSVKEHIPSIFNVQIFTSGRLL
jgi:hypothetical protein